MIRNPRVWFYVSGLWLVFGGLAHLAAHTWFFVLENGMLGLLEFAMNAMKQARSTTPLSPSLWHQFRLFSVSFGLLLLFAGSLNIVLAATRAPRPTLQAVALFATVFWTVAFIPFALVDPMLQAILVTIVAVPLHAIAWLTASQPEDDG